MTLHRMIIGTLTFVSGLRLPEPGRLRCNVYDAEAVVINENNIKQGILPGVLDISQELITLLYTTLFCSYAL